MSSDDQNQTKLNTAIDASNKGDFATAVAIWTELAEAGHAKAQCNLGQAYAYGRGVPKDIVQARKWLVSAAAQGDSYAKMCLDNLSTEGSSGHESQPQHPAQSPKAIQQPTSRPESPKEASAPIPSKAIWIGAAAIAVVVFFAWPDPAWQGECDQIVDSFIDTNNGAISLKIQDRELKEFDDGIQWIDYDLISGDLNVDRKFLAAEGRWLNRSKGSGHHVPMMCFEDADAGSKVDEFLGGRGAFSIGKNQRFIYPNTTLEYFDGEIKLIQNQIRLRE